MSALPWERAAGLGVPLGHSSDPRASGEKNPTECPGVTGVSQAPSLPSPSPAGCDEQRPTPLVLALTVTRGMGEGSSGTRAW